LGVGILQPTPFPQNWCEVKLKISRLRLEMTGGDLGMTVVDLVSDSE